MSASSLVSIIIPVYNRTQYLPEAIESVLSQTYKNYEIIVVDDGSTVDLKLVLEPYKDRIKYIRQDNKGLAGARNIGIRNSLGRYIAFLDDDDLFMPRKLEIQADILDKNPGVGFVFSDCYEFSGREKENVSLNLAVARDADPKDFTELFFLVPNVRVPVVMSRKDCFMDTGFFDESLAQHEDGDMFLRIALRWEVRFSDYPSASVRTHASNMSKDRAGMYAALIKSANNMLQQYPEFKTKIGKEASQRLAELHFGLGEELSRRRDIIGALWQFGLSRNKSSEYATLVRVAKLLLKSFLKYGYRMKTVLHYKSGVFLPITENWIYRQIINVHRYAPIVYCLDEQNLDVYPLSHIRSLNFKRGNSHPEVLFNKLGYRFLKFYPAFFFYLRRDRPSLAHAHFGPSGYNFLGLKRIFGLPLITTFYGYDLSMLPRQCPEWRRNYRKLFRWGDCFLVEGNHMKKCLIELGCPEEKVTVQHLGVDLEKIKFMLRTLEAGGPIRILIAGSFREKKGIPCAIEAIGILKKTQSGLDIKVTVIGDSGGDPGEEAEKRKILDKVREYDLGGSITFSGYQPHDVFISELYKHHIFLSPSIIASDGDTEGGAPVSIIEASASGMPVVSTFHCDIPEVVIDGKSGYLVPERDSAALADKLKDLIFNPGIWAEMGEFSRPHIEENYDVRKQGRRLEYIYDKFAQRN